MEMIQISMEVTDVSTFILLQLSVFLYQTWKIILPKILNFKKVNKTKIYNNSGSRENISMEVSILLFFVSL